MSYQKVTGPLMANSHPGSYCGQDAYTDMFVTESNNGLLHRQWTGASEHGRSSRSIELYARSASRINRGGNEMDEPVMMGSQKQHSGITEDGTSTTLTAQEKERPIVGETIVRRLSPMECERLQNFPDNWTLIGEPVPKYDNDGNVIEVERFYIDENGKRKKVTDSARYKALGNSVALPYWEYLARRIASHYERPATMGGLFSGIGGFELAFLKCGAKPLWSSEIESFPIAVMKQHFGDAETKGDVYEFM